MKHPATSSLHLRLAALALAVLTLAVHGVDVTHEFLNWDDELLVAKNELLNPVTGAHLLRFWSGPVQGLYSPLAYTLWALAAAVGRVSMPDADGVTLNPAVFHAVNVLLHTGCVLMVFAITWQLTRRLLPAAIAAAFFAVHPLVVEPVAWISGMNNLLAGMFSLATIAAYVRWASGPLSGKQGAKRYALVAVLFLAACMSKPTAIVTPLVVAAIDLLILRRPLKQIAAGVAPLLLAAVPFILVGRQAQVSGGIFSPSLPQRLLIAADAIGFYLGKLVCPWPLHMDYSRTPEWVVGRGVTSAAIGAMVVLVAAIAMLRRWSWAAGALAVFIGAMCLTLGLVPFDFQIYSTVADRYAYLALLGPAILIAFALARAPKAVGGFAAVLLLPLIVLTFRQSLTWATTDRLVAQQVANKPHSLAAHTILAGVANRRGDRATAEQHYRDILAIRPTLVDTNVNLANLLRETGRHEEAIRHYQTAFNAGERKALLFNNWGLALFALKRYPEAADAFFAALEADPNLVNGHINLALVLANLGRWDESERHFRAALQLNPGSLEAEKGLAKLQQVRPR